MVASATVTVSLSVTVSTAVTVMKMLVVIPLTLVLVLVPPTAKCPLPLLLLPSSPPPGFSVGAGAGLVAVVSDACVMGTTRRGASSEEVVDDGEGGGGTGAEVVAMVVMVLVVGPGSGMATGVLLVRSLVEVVSGLLDGEETTCSVTESFGASELVLTKDDALSSSAELVWGATVTYAVDEGTVTVTAPARPVVVGLVGEEVNRASVVVVGLLLLVCVLLSPEAPGDDVSPGWTVTYVVDDGTVTVTSFAFPVAEPVEPEPSLVWGLFSALEVPVPSILAVTVVLPVPSTEVGTEVAFSPGTFPNTSSTAALEKQPTCTPVVVFSGIAAHTSSSEAPQPATSHVPDAVQKAYLA